MINCEFSVVRLLTDLKIEFLFPLLLHSYLIVYVEDTMRRCPLRSDAHVFWGIPKRHPLKIFGLQKDILSGSFFCWLVQQHGAVYSLLMSKRSHKCSI